MSNVTTESDSNRGSGGPASGGLSSGRKLLLSGLVVVAFFAIAELLLRLAGVQYATHVEGMQFTFPIDEYNQNSPEPFLSRDEVLFWRPTAGVLGHNAQGFYGPGFSTSKPEGVFRIVCLGDSCTHFGPITYPDILRDYLEKVAPGKFEVINAGVIGYTSFQGMRLLETEVLKWEPDLVTVYFGWNDHWLARGYQDKEQTGTQAAAEGVLARLRLFQVMRHLTQRNAVTSDSAMRVQPGDYRSNLQRIGELCADHDCRYWYLTAPHAFDLGVPPYLIESGEASNLDELLGIHRKYNEIVREVAASRDARVVDLANEMDTMAKNELFIDDHIHLSVQGKLYVAQRLVKSLEQAGILQQPDITQSPDAAESTGSVESQPSE